MKVLGRYLLFPACFEEIALDELHITSAFGCSARCWRAKVIARWLAKLGCRIDFRYLNSLL